MKKLGAALLIVSILLLSACGGGSMNSNSSDPASSVGGIYMLKLTPTQGSGQGEATALVFTDTFGPNDDPNNDDNGVANLVGTNLTITTNNGCISNTDVQVAGYVGTPKTFSLWIEDTTNALLTMQGQMTNGNITGTWTLAPTGTGGTNCMGNGTFTMTPTGGAYPTRG